MAQIPFYEVNEAIVAMGGEDLNLCMQCGMCSGSCPWRLVDGEFFVRQMIRMGQLGLEGYESDDILYGCTTCGVCPQRCPRGVSIIDIMRSMRSMIAEAGAIPGVLKTVLGSVHGKGNPWSEARENRSQWMADLDVPLFAEGTEHFLSICCTSAYDVRSRKIARSLASVLGKAGVSFGVLGNEESCCGESVRKIGDEALFGKLVEKNSTLFQERGVRSMIVNSPHCLYTYKKEYREFGAEFDVRHHTEVLWDLIQAGRIGFNKEIKTKVTFHDPCYLGRHGEVYDPPRRILEAIPGIEVVEMRRSGKNSLCCGAGGGRLWMETPPEKRFSDLRVLEAVKTGANVLATACPYCISMLEDSRKTTNQEDAIEILDVAELVVAALA